VLDDNGKPIAGVEVRLSDVATKAEGRYESTLDYKTQTDADGRFRFDQTPIASASIWLNKPGYTRPGLGMKITTPAENVELRMLPAALVRIAVDFAKTPRPQEYLVEMEPEGGSAVGKWGGSGMIDAAGQITFKNVPPGKYVVKGRPNPGSEKEITGPVTVELKGGEQSEVRLQAK
jgi:hypothetical protein